MEMILMYLHGVRLDLGNSIYHQMVDSENKPIKGKYEWTQYVIHDRMSCYCIISLQYMFEE